MKITCCICNKNFETNYLQTRICSKNCKLSLRRKERNNIIKPCSICSTLFNGEGNKSVCSVECKTIKKNNYKLKIKRITIKQCVICSIDFTARGPKSTCSIECSKKSINIRVNKRYNGDINFKLCDILRSRLGHAIKNNQKVGSVVDDLGCTISELKTYLEKQFFNNPRTNEKMTWDNHTLGGWHIDHHIPLISFNLEDRKELLKACYFTNLKPLWAKENIIKKDRMP